MNKEIRQIYTDFLKHDLLKFLREFPGWYPIRSIYVKYGIFKKINNE